MPDNINQRLLDLLLQHDIDLLRVSAGTEAEIEREVNRITQSLIAILAVNDPTEPIRTSFQKRRLDAVIAEGQRAIRDAYRKLYRDVRRQLLDVMTQEQGAFRGIVNQGIGVDLMPDNPLAGSGLRAIIDERVITANANDAATLKEFFEREAAAHHKRFQGALQQGFSQAENLSQLTARLRAIEGTSAREATAVARTAYNHVQNQTRIELMQRNANLFRGVIWISVLDGNTTKVCLGLSNGLFNLNTGQPLPESPVQRKLPRIPPAHFACRSHLYPLTKTAAEVGADSARGRRALEQLTPEQRALLNPDPPVQESYPEWLRRQPASVQLKVLGRTRRDLWLQGKLNLRELTTQKGRPLRLDELERRRKAS